MRIGGYRHWISLSPFLTTFSSLIILQNNIRITVVSRKVHKSTHIEVEVHSGGLGGVTGEAVVFAAAGVVSALVQDGAVREVGLAGVRVHVFHLDHTWLGHLASCLPVHLHHVVHNLLHVCNIRQHNSYCNNTIVTVTTLFSSHKHIKNYFILLKSLKCSVRIIKSLNINH